MPYGAHVLHVGNQGGVLCLWVLVDPDQPERAREFLICGTGHPVPSGTHPYLGSAIVSPFVWHVFGGNLVNPGLDEIAKLAEIARERKMKDIIAQVREDQQVGIIWPSTEEEKPDATSS